MKQVTSDEFQAHLQQYLEAVQQESIVITRDGQPCAVLHSVPDDLEAAELSHSAEFWTMIGQRRQEPTIPWEEAKRELG